MSALPSLPESTDSAPLRRLDLDHQDSSRQQSDFINGLLAANTFTIVRIMEPFWLSVGMVAAASGFRNGDAG